MILKRIVFIPAKPPKGRTRMGGSIQEGCVCTLKGPQSSNLLQNRPSVWHSKQRENSRKKQPRGSWVSKVPGKQPEKKRKTAEKNSRKNSCFACLGCFFRLFVGFFFPSTSPGTLSAFCFRLFSSCFQCQTFSTSVDGRRDCNLEHQNRTIAIASDFRVDGAKSPEIPQKERVLGSEIAARNRKSLATFHRSLKSQCSIAFACLRNRAISGVCGGHRNRKSQKSLRFWCAKDIQHLCRWPQRLQRKVWLHVPWCALSLLAALQAATCKHARSKSISGSLHRFHHCMLFTGQGYHLSRRRTNVQQLTCKMVWSFSFYSLKKWP